MSFFKTDNLRLVTSGRWLSRPDPTVVSDGIGIDTRADLRGRIFVAIRGIEHDGHDHLDAAATGGATLAIVDREVAAPPTLGLLLVDDTRRALGRLARAHRRTLDGTRVVAITGSSGKTTTKRLVDAVLGAAMTGTAAPSSYNNDIGVPLTILAARRGDRYLVIEIGTSAPGEVAALARMTEPDVAVITNIGPAHLEGFGSIEAIAREKAALLSHLPSDGLAVVNADAPALDRAASCARTVIRFGDDERADLRLTDRGPVAHAPSPNPLRAGESEEPDRWWFEINGRWRFEIRLPGRHNAMNAIVAVAVGRRFGLSDEIMREGLAAVEPTAMRMTPQRVGDLLVCNDAYNANPDSVKAALETFVEVAASSSRRVVVLGDMLELGADAPALHCAVGAYIAKLDPPIDHVLLVGEHARDVRKGLGREWPREHVRCHAAMTPRTISSIARAVEPGDAVLIKGSRGMALERIVEKLAALAPVVTSTSAGGASRKRTRSTTGSVDAL